MSLADTIVWQEARQMPEVVDQTLGGVAGMAAEVSTTLSRPGLRRIVLTGNGASLHAAISCWHAARAGVTSLPVEWVPAGHLGSGAVPLTESDALVVFSTSGELRDVIDALDIARPGVVVALTAHADSRISRAADLVLPVVVRSQQAVTHTQAYASATVLGLWLAHRLRRGAAGDGLADAAATAIRGSLAAAPTWASSTLTALPPVTSSVCFGGGSSWPAALQASLMLREIGGLPSEPAETREAVTSVRCSLGPGQLVLALPAATDRYFAEAVESMARTGAHVVVAPEAARASELGSLSLFAAPLALGILLAQERGLDPDCPKWFDEYLAVARVVPVPAHEVIGDLTSQVSPEQRTETHAADQSRSQP